MSQFQKLADVSLADRARDLIRQAIFEGRIQPNERITIEKIAAQFGISRTPVREALKALESDGTLRILPRKGAIVEQLTIDEIFDRYSVRALLEGYAVAQACARSDDAFIEALSTNCAALEKKLKKESAALPHVRELMSLNSGFHQMIHNQSGSVAVLRALESLRLPQRYQLAYWQSLREQKASLAAHEQLVKSFEKKDAARARVVMEKHLIHARDFFVASAAPGVRSVADMSGAAARRARRK